MLSLILSMLVLGFSATLGLMWYAHRYVGRMNDASLWLDRALEFDRVVQGSQAKRGTLDQAI